MAPSPLQHRRTHNLLLISRLLNQRDAASPFTLVLDDLEQSGKPLLAEFMKRAKSSNTKVILVSWETLRKPRDADVVVKAWKQSLREWQNEIASHLKAEPEQKKLIVFDSLNTLAASESSHLPALLSSFIGPSSSILALYHTDVPESLHSGVRNAYSPSALTLLRYLATTIFTTHSLHHVLARKAARERSHAEPVFGLEQGVEGVLQGLGANGLDGLVLEMEHRRKSGRGVREWYFLPLRVQAASATSSIRPKEIVTLLEDHSEYKSSEEIDHGTANTSGEADTTFEIGLTEKQRRDREGVVLPYFDAQKGGGDGGRILYDIGSEDDWDEDEDEI
ncbi:killer toxin sensitivity protein [Zymoseptoria brevis]|uniref:Elongator complex protein 5 n=1 Tax=Zymoseptoria brevis TaxID=1047168 RepID=A0A0F4GNR4_9PEZI|nr:killer toxin sensitivity protein [Zymoseptoria brevis]